ncbi:hypothetical protein ATE49_04725 [Elizabethkingia miricola]|uniref:Uncharacterized protein n=1 Tax=Elizabethkingia miricola TaxID=172045 RepID=A0ABY3NGP7_ELIMR|nr:hypothetical protein [Elizabethkingia miricola]OBS12531.1 hypothetical protein ATE49_04725 [Elizabethkingia miricola]TYO91994.1 hypothetical protein LX74_02245 [Elizabethkingia miricola]
MWYKVDFRKFGLLLCPPFLRGDIYSVFISVICITLEKLHDIFLETRDYNIERAVHNSQLCHLRGLLNDKFDSDRRITIEDPINKEETYIYTDSENKPKYLGELILYPASEFSDDQVDFIVKVPIALKDYYDQIYNTVDYYRLASKRFRIELV